MASKELLDLLNESIARELQVTIQYMWQHVMAKGIKSPQVSGIFKSIAITEMKHAEIIAERLDFLGGVPATKPSQIVVGETLEEMIKLDQKAEEEALVLYKKVIEISDKEQDITTRKIFEDILAEEEEHLNEFSKLLK